MIIYIDPCCYSRPYDNKHHTEQLTVQREIRAIMETNVRNPIEVRKAGLHALNRELGYEGTQAFMSLHFEGVGDWTEDRHHQPEESFEDFMSRIEQADAEITARNSAAKAKLCG